MRIPTISPRGGVAAAVLASAIFVAPAAQASLIADGITYTLTESTTADPLTNEFVLSISGINGASDTEGGRSGVNAIAFNSLDHLSSALMITPPSGWAFQTGGLNANGCNGSGNFYCFDNTAIPPIPSTALAADSTLSFVFDVTLSSGGTFAGYDPDFKIDWVGSKNNYDLVSKTLTPCTANCGGTSVPEPGSLALLGSGLIGLAFFFRRRIFS